MKKFLAFVVAALLGPFCVAKTEFRVVTSPELRPLVEKLAAVAGRSIAISSPNGFLAERELLKNPNALGLLTHMPDAFGLAQLKSKGVDPQLIPFASEPLAIVTNPANPARVPEQSLITILRQGRANWASFGGENQSVTFFAPAETTDFGAWLRTLPLKDSNFGPTVRTYSSSAEALSRVRADRFAAAIVSSLGTRNQSGITVLKTSQLLRPLFWAVPKTRNREMLEFLEAVKSESAQKVAQDFGLKPFDPKNN